MFGMAVSRPFHGAVIGLVYKKCVRAVTTSFRYKSRIFMQSIVVATNLRDV
jgi:hypothetical protein